MSALIFRAGHVGRLPILLGVVAVLATLTKEAPAEILYVNHMATPGSGEDGSSWARAFRHLQDALASANAGDQIWVARGVYRPDEGADYEMRDRYATFQLKTGVEIYGGFSGTETRLDQRDFEGRLSILSGDIDQNDVVGETAGITESYEDILGLNAYSVVTASGVDATSVLDGFVITGGLANHAAIGGGMFNEGGSPVVRICHFIGNATRGVATTSDLERGGAMCNLDASPVIINCRFTNNAAGATVEGQPTTYGQGGAIYNSNSTVTITGCHFSGNTAGRGEAFPGQGGAISNGHSTIDIVSCVFENNSAGGGSITSQRGGGGAVHSWASTLHVSNTIFRSNRVLGSQQQGGAVYNAGLGHGPTDFFFRFEDCEFASNSAGVTGGAVHSTTNSHYTDCSFSQNNAVAGGAVHQVNHRAIFMGCRFTENAAVNGGGFQGERVEVSMTDCVFSRNRAQAHGGAVQLLPTDSLRSEMKLFTFLRCRFLANSSAAYGGALFWRGRGSLGDSYLIDACEFASNTAHSGGGAIKVGRISSLDGSENDGIIRNSLFYGNSVEESGGAISFPGLMPHVDLINNTFTANQARRGIGGAIAGGPGGQRDRKIINCIFWDNEAKVAFEGKEGPGGVSDSVAPEGGEISYSLVEHLQAGPDDHNLDGTDPGNAPRFVSPPKQNEDGEWEADLRLHYLSPGIDLGKDSVTGGLDFAGQPRVQKRVDMGAYETRGGPAVLRPSSTIEVSFEEFRQLDVFDLGAVFDETAQVFEVEEMIPPGRLAVAVLPSWGERVSVNLANISLDTAGRTVIVFSASTSGGTSHRTPHRLNVDVVAERLYVNAGADVAGSGASWGTALPDLQKALSIAETARTREIWVAEGVYFPDEGYQQQDNDRRSTFKLPRGVDLLGGFNGTESDGSKRDPAANPTILSGDIDLNDIDPDGNGIADSWEAIVGENAYHVVTASGVDATSVLDGFIVTAGQADGPESENDRRGGGMLCVDGHPQVRGCRFVGNLAAGDGGAVFASVANGSIDRSDFLNNRSGDDGGALYAWSSMMRMEGVRMSGNSAVDQGGAFYNTSSSIEVISSLFSGNVAEGRGGGVYVKGDSSPRFINCTVSGNRAADVGGGFVIEQTEEDPSPAPELVNTIVWRNEAMGEDASVEASVYDPAGSIVYTRSLIHHLSEATLPNVIDGKSNADALLFKEPVDPSGAPTQGGDFRLLDDAIVIDRGVNIVTGIFLSGRSDLAGSPRVLDGDRDGLLVVDLGAYESTSGIKSFGDLYPGLGLEDDANRNARSNYLDYALGLDPTVPLGALGGAEIVQTRDKTFLTVSRRIGRGDVFMTLEFSPDLRNWIEAREGLDFSVDSHQQINPDREEMRVQIMGAPESGKRTFWRQKFEGTPR